MLRNIVAAMLVATKLVACSSLPESEAQFSTLVETWIQTGSSVVDATAKLESRGFRVTRYGPKSNWPDQREVLVASRTRWAGLSSWLCDREWRAIFYIEQEKIAQAKGLVILTCL